MSRTRCFVSRFLSFHHTFLLGIQPRTDLITPLPTRRELLRGLGRLCLFVSTKHPPIVLTSFKGRCVREYSEVALTKNEDCTRPVHRCLSLSIRSRTCIRCIRQYSQFQKGIRWIVKLPTVKFAALPRPNCIIYNFIFKNRHF